MSNPQRVSYLFMVVLLLLVGWLHMATLLLSALFGYFALRQFSLGRSKALALILFVVVLAAVTYGLFYFSKQAYVAFPKIAETTIPAVVEYAERQGLELPFTDLHSLKSVALMKVNEKMGEIPKLANAALFRAVYLVIGLVVAVSLFLNARLDLDTGQPGHRDNLYALTATEIGLRFRTFYGSFARVMGAQILIALINSVLTAAFLVCADFPYALVLVVFTFLCGLLPIIGNIISNTVITGVGFTISPKMAVLALAFLVLVHKGEYFLNSAIIGERIRNPMWLTLIGLLVGERLMGIPGMILAPVILHYIKIEASRARVGSDAERPAPASVDPPSPSPAPG